MVLAVASMGITSAFLSSSLTTESNFTGTPESQKAVDLIKRRLGREEPVRDVVIVRSATRTVDQAAFQQQVESVRSRLVAAAPSVVRIGPTYYQNMKDLDEVPEDARRELTFVPVETMDEVLKVALHPSAAELRAV